MLPDESEETAKEGQGLFRAWVQLAAVLVGLMFAQSQIKHTGHGTVGRTFALLTSHLGSIPSTSSVPQNLAGVSLEQRWLGIAPSPPKKCSLMIML